MVKEIIKDTDILSQKSEKVQKNEDISGLAQDLIDTANYHKENTPRGCAGLAAIQIGVAKRVCVVEMNDRYVLFINPRFAKASKQKYTSTERCLSFDDEKETERFFNVTVEHEERTHIRDGGWLSRKKKIPLNQMHSLVLQHEVDHMNGVLI